MSKFMASAHKASGFMYAQILDVGHCRSIITYIYVSGCMHRPCCVYCVSDEVDWYGYTNTMLRIIIIFSYLMPIDIQSEKQWIMGQNNINRTKILTVNVIKLYQVLEL